jgi:hypothetical protein
MGCHFRLSQFCISQPTKRVFRSIVTANASIARNANVKFLGPKRSMVWIDLLSGYQVGFAIAVWANNHGLFHATAAGRVLASGNSTTHFRDSNSPLSMPISLGASMRILTRLPRIFDTVITIIPSAIEILSPSFRLSTKLIFASLQVSGSSDNHKPLANMAK